MISSTEASYLHFLKKNGPVGFIGPNSIRGWGLSQGLLEHLVELGLVRDAAEGFEITNRGRAALEAFGE